jgi:hypothetical protein
MEYQMLKQEVNQNVNSLVKRFFRGNPVLSYNPILAGGFPLALWKLSRLYDTPQRWGELERALFGNSHKKYHHHPEFGDIDIWFEEDSILNHPCNSRLKEVLLGQHKHDTFKMVDSNYKSDLASFATLHGLKTTRFANTFSISTPDIPFAKKNILQFIKHTPASVEDLLSSFDLTLCKVAWKDDTLYYDEAVEKDFENFELSINNKAPYSVESIYSRMHNANRAFKYSLRYSLDFNQEMSDIIFSMYVEAKDVEPKDSLPTPINQNVHTVNILPPSNIPTPLAGSVGGNSVCPVISIPSIITAAATHPYGKNWKASMQADTLQQFLNNYSHFIFMKNYKNEYGLYLLDKIDKFPILKKSLDSSSPEIIDDVLPYVF